MWSLQYSQQPRPLRFCSTHWQVTVDMVPCRENGHTTTLQLVMRHGHSCVVYGCERLLVHRAVHSDGVNARGPQAFPFSNKYKFVHPKKAPGWPIFRPFWKDNTWNRTKVSLNNFFTSKIQRGIELLNWWGEIDWWPTHFERSARIGVRERESSVHNRVELRIYIYQQNSVTKVISHLFLVIDTH